ncbi:hypothetical protein PGTUg99_000107, partial [Puccinia graminis f. sp. tritici]
FNPPYQDLARSNPPTMNKLLLYSLFKQAVHGDVKSTISKRPGVFDMLVLKILRSHRDRPEARLLIESPFGLRVLLGHTAKKQAQEGAEEEERSEENESAGSKSDEKSADQQEEEEEDIPTSGLGPTRALPNSRIPLTLQPKLTSCRHTHQELSSLHRQPPQNHSASHPRPRMTRAQLKQVKSPYKAITSSLQNRALHMLRSKDSSTKPPKHSHSTLSALLSTIPPIHTQICPASRSPSPLTIHILLPLPSYNLTSKNSSNHRFAAHSDLQYPPSSTPLLHFLTTPATISTQQKSSCGKPFL